LLAPTSLSPSEEFTSIAGLSCQQVLGVLWVWLQERHYGLISIPMFSIKMAISFSHLLSKSHFWFVDDASEKVESRETTVMITEMSARLVGFG
jgi:hypothetical protein